MLFGKIYEDRAGGAPRKTLTASSLALISNVLMFNLYNVHVKTYVKFIVQSPGGPLKCRKIHEM